VPAKIRARGQRLARPARPQFLMVQTAGAARLRRKVRLAQYARQAALGGLTRSRSDNVLVASSTPASTRPSGARRRGRESFALNFSEGRTPWHRARRYHRRPQPPLEPPAVHTSAPARSSTGVDREHHRVDRLGGRERPASST
jgi:hypothetical protein